MNLKNLINVLNAGNIALGSKISSLLTEDCVILEYTNDSVLFLKEGKLVSAKFKNPMAENMTPESIIDNEVVTVSGRALNRELKAKLTAVIEGVVTGDLLSAEENLNAFCETYYQFNTLKAKCPELFAESLVKSNKGYLIRKKAFNKITAFKAALFNSVVVEESTSNDLAALSSLVEEHAIVLALGKKKLSGIVTDALLGNSILSESITNYLYVIAEELQNDNEELEDLDKSGYDLEQGSFPEEDLDGEDLENDSEYDDIPEPGDEDDMDETGEESDKEFEPFDPSSLSEEDIKELHKKTLSAILNAIKDFVTEKANDLEDANIPADLDEKITVDLEDLEDPETSDARLSEIEARWQEMIGYFLDSDYHTPDKMKDDFGDGDSIDTTVSDNDSEDVEDIDAEGGEGAGAGEGGLPPAGDLGDMGELPPEENPENPQGV